MRRERRYGPFKGVVLARGTFAPENSASDALNARSRGGGLTPRNGFQRLTTRPQNAATVYGLVHLAGYGDDYADKAELVSFRADGAGPVRPRVVPLPLADVPAETTIPVDLEALPVGGFTFGGDGYIFQPGATRSLYRRPIGGSGLTVVQDSAYTAPPTDPSFAATPTDLSTLAYTPPTETQPDTIAYSDPAQTTAADPLVETDGITLSVKSVDDTGSDGVVTLTVTYGTAFSVAAGQRFCSIAVDALGVMRVIRGSGAKLELKLGGVFVEVTDFTVRGGNTPAWALTGVIPAGTILSGYRLTFRGSIYQDGKKLAKVYPLQLGGVLLNATSAATRPWGVITPKAITYGARTVVGGVYGPIKSLEVPAAGIAGPNARNTGTPGFPIGNRVTLYYDPPMPYTGTAQFLRKDAGGVWRVLNEQPSGATLGVTDARREDELSALATSPNDGTAAPAATPPFSTQGLKYGVPYKGWVVWLFKGGKENVQHSKFGDPLELYDPKNTYSASDTTRPAEQTLADGFDDEPVCGFQAGQLLVILGKRGAYTSYGDYPAAMVPPRRIPETSGVVGFRAACRWKGPSGGYGVAWLDAHGNVWSLTSVPRFDGDASARPNELSVALRGNLRRFLTGSDAGDLSGALLGYDEAEDSLFVVNGRKAAIFRPSDVIDGSEHVDLALYNVVEDQYGTTGDTGWSAISLTTTQLNGGANWTEGPPDTIATLAAGATSKTIHRGGFLAALVPAMAMVYAREGRLVETSTGAIRRTARVLDPETGGDLVTDLPNGTTPLAFDATLPTGAQVAGGALVSEITVTNTRLAAWDVPGNYAVTNPAAQASDAPSGTTVSRAMTIAVTYTAGGPKPRDVRLSVTGQAKMTFGNDPGVEGDTITGAVSNDLGAPVPGTITEPPGATPGNPPPPIPALVDSGTEFRTVTLVNGAGSTTLGMSASGAHSRGNAFGWSFTASGVVSPVVASYSARVEMRATYGDGYPETTGTFAALAFAGPALYALRSDGAICALERDARDGSPLRAGDIDAGRAMPPGFWRFGDDEGPRRRVKGVRQVLDGGAATGFSVLTPQVVTLAPGSRRWCDFPPNAAGNRLAFRIDFDQTLGRIDSVVVEMTPLSETKLS